MTTTKNIEQMLSENGICVTGITGVSMLPMLRQGEDRVLLVRPTFPLQPNTVALYKRGQDYVLHRVIDYKDGVYRFRGDNCAADEFIEEERILGVLSGFWRGEIYHDCTGAENAAYAARAKKTLPLRRVKAALTAWIKHIVREKTDGESSGTQ